MTTNLRPTWDEYFLDIAKTVSTRSLDQHTKHGCVLTHDNKIVGTGFNSFPYGMADDNLPTTRPEKYDWHLHAELNSVLNMTLAVRGFTAYITGEPCFNCLKFLYQRGASVIHWGKQESRMIDDGDRRLKQMFLDNIIGGCTVNERSITFRRHK